MRYKVIFKRTKKAAAATGSYDWVRLYADNENQLDDNIITLNHYATHEVVYEIKVVDFDNYDKVYVHCCWKNEHERQ